MLDLDQLSQIMPNLFFWKKDLNSNYVDYDSNIAKQLRLKNKKDAYGLSDYEIPCFAKIAASLQLEDKMVVTGQDTRQFLTITNYPNSGWSIAIVNKSPWYDSNQNILGTFGYGLNCSRFIKNFSELFNEIFTEKKIISASYILGSDNCLTETATEIKLTPRESECLFLLVRGKSIKQIGLILALSPRTIEQYVENLRYKFNCLTKSDLVSKAIDCGFLQYIPISFFNSRLDFQKSWPLL